jgi:zinc protease
MSDGKTISKLFTSHPPWRGKVRMGGDVIENKSTPHPRPLPQGERGILWILLFAFCLLFFDFSYANPPPLPAFPPLQFHPPKPQRFELPNGLVVFLLEDHELPLIKVQVLVRAGSQYDPADKVGLSSIFGPSMTEGGSTRYPPDDVQRALDITGGSLGFSVSMEDTAGSMSGRTADFDKLFAIFADVLMAPQFKNEYVNLNKEKALEGLRRMNDEPEEIVRREFRHLVYGKAHPYARTPDPDSINRINWKDLFDMHQRYFHPNDTMIAVSGDFQSSAMKDKITAALGGWARAEVTYPPVPPVIPTSESKLYYVQLPINQSQIEIGHTGLARHNPDHFAWEVFNELWGGGATSRLFRTVRTQQGLAYEVASVFTEPADLGLIVAICQTRGPETPAAMQSILQINQEVQQAPFTEAEISSAKEAIRNRFVENFTASDQIVEEEMAMEFRGYPKDYLETYTDKIGLISPDDLKRVGKKYVQSDKSVMLVVGDLSTFDKPLSTIGHPQELRIPDYRTEVQPW